jgi:predicted alpha-1,2-mannosidase
MKTAPALLAPLLVLAASVAVAGVVDPLRYVDPFIGTGGHGHTYPGASLPFGMVQLSPDTRLDGWDGCAGYHYSDDRIFGFSHTHLSGTGVSDYGDILLLPATGDIRWQSGYGRKPGEGYGSRFRKATEKATPGYYAVQLDDYGTKAELTTTLRAGIHRYTFPRSDSAYVLIDLKHRDEVIESSLHVVNDTEVEGLRRSKAWATDQRIYFVARFSKPFSALVAVDDVPHDGLREAEGKNLKAALRFRTRAGERVLVKVGISAVSVEGARRNLETEIPGWDFDAVHRAARQAWRQALAHIEIGGGTPEQRTVFYTALYHALLQPNTFTDVDGQYRGRDGQVHRADGWTQYSVFSLWDTFRAAHPLYTILEPARTVEFVRTFLAQYAEGGLLPVWELAGNETNCMIGYHAVSVIADAYAKGIRGFDAERALAAMKASAMQERGGLPAYRRFGYIPGDRESESVSKTLEYAYDDWCIAQMAGALGHESDAADFLRRAQSWKNLLDPATHFMRPKLRARFKTPFDPTEVDFHFTEANSWQYSFFVPQDIKGEIASMGGAPAFAAKLDSLFTAPSKTSGREQADITGLVGQYAHGNEPSHHMAYLYVHAGQPWKTQARVRQLLDTMYAARPDGLAGNEDCGQMSAWYVLSALGFYSVTPGQDTYVIGTPLFERAAIHLANGRSFRITAQGAGLHSPYIQSARLNGQPFDRAFLHHAEILAGGDLVFRMGSEPNRKWGVGAGNVPVSRIGTDPILPVPYVAAGVTPFRDSTRVVLASPDAGASIRYTIDGSDPTEASSLYSSSLDLRPAATLRFFATIPGHAPTPVQEATFRKIEGHRRITLAFPPHHQYTAGGNDALIDGERGSDDFRLGDWQGFYGVDLEAVLDLGEEVEIHRLAVGFLQDQNSWIFMPLSVAFETSRDGATYEVVGEVDNDVDPRADGAVRKDFGLSFPARRARWVHVRAKAPVMCPDWHKGAGNRSFIFADEILVE